MAQHSFLLSVRNKDPQILSLRSKRTCSALGGRSRELQRMITNGDCSVSYSRV